MSKILKGLTEANSVYGHSDPDREYGASAPTYRKRGPYSHTDDDDGNPFAEYERQQRMFAVGRAQKAAKEKAQRDADHDRLATGTNEEQLDELSNEKLGQYKTAAALDAGKADLAGDYKKADKRFSGIVKATKKQFANDTKPVQEANGEKEYILYINNKPAAKYSDLMQAQKDMSAVKRKHPQVPIELKHQVCDLETLKKINENQTIGNVLSEAKSLLTQLDESTQQQVINALKKSIVKEFEGDVETITAPTSNREPSNGFAIKVHGPLGFRQGMSATTLWYGLSAVFPNKYPRKDFENYGAQMSSPQASVLNQINRSGSAVVADGISSRDMAETLAKKLGTYNPGIEHHKPIGMNHVEVVEQSMDEATEKSSDTFKNVYPRINNPQILGTKNRAKSAYYPPAKPPVKKLDKPLPESLGDELTSKSIQALQQVKQQLEQQRMADLEQWEKDFKQNTVAKFTARQPSFMQQQPTQVAQSNEKHSVLKARLVQLNKAIEKQQVLDKLVQKLEHKGLMTPNIEAGVDTSMLVRDGARDNYVELNRKLDKALEYVKNRLMTNKAAYAKPKSIDEDELDENCWKGYHKEGNKELFGKTVPNCVKNEGVAEEQQHSCPHCGGELVSEELMNEKKDACYYKVKSRYKVWPSAYASGALVKCRKKGASNWGNGGKKNESSILEGIEQVDENLHQWFKEKWVRFGPDGKIRGDCARGDDSEGKPKCLPQAKAHNLGKKGRASAAARKRREDPNPERSGKAINVNTKKKSNEGVAEGSLKEYGDTAKGQKMLTKVQKRAIDRVTSKRADTDSKYAKKNSDTADRAWDRMTDKDLEEAWSQKYKKSINCSNPKGFSQKAHCAGKKK